MKYLLIIPILVLGCGQVTNKHKLPIFGNHDIHGMDTTYYTVGDFRLWNQDSVEVSPKSLEGKIYVADFFFTSCPTICPLMKAQMVRVYDKVKDMDNVLLISHTIDPEYDSVALLKNYALNLGVDTKKWQFLTGEKDSIYALAQTYMVIADEDSSAPGGFVHSGAFILVDGQRRIRGVYDGTMADQVDLLMRDIDLLRKENE